MSAAIAGFILGAMFGGTLGALAMAVIAIGDDRDE